MKHRKSLIKYQRNPVTKISGTTILVGIIFIGLLWWLISKNKSVASYKNLERWEIVRNEKGFTTEIIIHRDATEK